MMRAVTNDHGAAPSGTLARETSSSVLHAPDGRSLGELISGVSDKFSTLMQLELALAKAEAKESATRAVAGVGLFVGAAVGALFLLLFLSISGWWALGLVIGNGWSALVVAGVWAIIAGVLALMGKKNLERIRSLDRTVETLGKLPNAVKGHEEENR